MFKINHSDFMKYEDDKLEINRPHGSGDYVFLYFPVPMLHMINGKLTESKKNACILYAPSDPQWFRSKETFLNSFIHFTDTEGEMGSYHFPTGEIFYPDSYERMNSILSELKNEALIEGKMYCEMSHSLITELMILCERSFADSEKSDLRRQFEKLRYDLLSECCSCDTVKDLPSKVYMSRTRFYECYKEFFKTTPKNDLLKARMERAAMLLTNKNKTVAQVSEEVGFKSIEHFTRYYKSYFGRPPKRNKQNV